MLFTRCPDCETTFRITAEALRKADGQVRCGRCACVFNGYNELRRPARRRSGSSPEESPAKAVARAGANARDGRSTAGALRAAEALSPGVDAASVEPASAAIPREASSGKPAIDEHGPDHVASAAITRGSDGAGATPDASVSPAPHTTVPLATEPRTNAAQTTEPHTTDPLVENASVSARSAPPKSALSASPAQRSARNSGGSAKTTENETDATIDDFSLAGVIAELEASAASDADVPSASSPGELVKSGPDSAPGESPPTGAAAGMADPAHALGTPSWVILDEARPQRFSPRVWIIACGAAAALLGLQVLHHHRGNLAVLGVVGPVIQRAYALLGIEIAPEWNIEQYEIVIDWDAVAQPNADGESNLKIAARIRNEGPRALPLPHVQVQLKDRWESTIGSRVFAPAEYLPPGRSVEYLLKEGQSALAELDILDPGPQAYGFALDVCVDAANGTLRCAEDEVFR